MASSISVPRILLAILVAIISYHSILATGLLTTEPPPNIAWQSQDLDNVLSAVAWSPDGGKIAVGVYDYDTYIGKVIVFSRSGELLWYSDSLGAVPEIIAWSPRGDALAVAASTELFVFDANGSLLWQQAVPSSISGLDWSPDGSLIAVASGKRIYAYNSSGVLEWETPDLSALCGSVTRVSWSPDSAMVACGCKSYRALVFSRTGALLWEAGDINGFSVSVSWSPDGSMLAIGTGYTTDNAGVYVYSNTGVLLWETLGLGYYVDSISWSPDGSMLFARVWDPGEADKLYVYSANGSLAWTLSPSYGSIDGAQWSPVASILAVGMDNRVYLYDGKSGVMLWQYTGLYGYFRDVSWEPNGTAIAVGADWYSGRSHGIILVFDFDGFGFLVLEGLSEAPASVQLTDTSTGDILEILLPQGATRVLYALGIINVTVNQVGGDHVIGPPAPGEVRVDRARAACVRLSTILSKIIILNPLSQNSTLVNITIEWQRGSWSRLSIEPGGEAVLWTFSGATYNLYGTMRGPPNCLGGPCSPSFSLAIAPRPGETISVTVPTLDRFLSLLVIDNSRSNESVEALVNIVWSNGSADFTMPPRSRASYWIKPGEYQVVIRINAPTPFVGGNDSLVETWNITVGTHGQYTVQVPEPGDLLAEVRFEGGPASEVVFRRGDSEWVIRDSRSGSVVWAEPGEYTVIAAYSPPANYIGVEFMIEIPLGNYTFKAGGSYILPIPSDSVVTAVLAPVTLYVPSDVAAGLEARVTIAVPGINRTLEAVLGPGDVLTVLTDPGGTLNVTVEYIYDGAVVETLAYILSNISGVESVELLPASIAPPQVGTTTPPAGPIPGNESPTHSPIPGADESFPAHFPGAGDVNALPGGPSPSPTVNDSGLGMQSGTSLGLVGGLALTGVGAILLLLMAAGRRRRGASDGVEELFPRELMKVYKPLEYLGSGGFAFVWKVWDSRTGRKCALKYPRPDIRRERPDLWNIVKMSFIHEMAKWHEVAGHENIVNICGYDFEPYPYILMEYIEGLKVDDRTIRNLRELINYYSIKGQRVPPKLAALIALHIARGLEHAHAKRIVHLDIKPENILLEGKIDRPIAKIADWGIAKIAGSIGASGVIGWTPFYSAPELQEIVRDKSNVDITNKSDIYSLGVIIKEMLGLTNDIDKTLIDKSIERDLALLAAEMTNPDPRHRPSAKDVVRRLERILYRYGIRL